MSERRGRRMPAIQNTMHYYRKNPRAPSMKISKLPKIIRIHHSVSHCIHCLNSMSKVEKKHVSYFLFSVVTKFANR